MATAGQEMEEEERLQRRNYSITREHQANDDQIVSQLLRRLYSIVNEHRANNEQIGTRPNNVSPLNPGYQGQPDSMDLTGSIIEQHTIRGQIQPRARREVRPLEAEQTSQPIANEVPSNHGREESSPNRIDVSRLKNTLEDEISKLKLIVNRLGPDCDHDGYYQCHLYDKDHINAATTAIAVIIEALTLAHVCANTFIDDLFRCHLNALRVLQKQECRPLPPYKSQASNECPLEIMSALSLRISCLIYCTEQQEKIHRSHKEVARSLAISLEKALQFQELYSQKGVVAMASVELLCDHLHYMASDLGKEISDGTLAELKEHQMKYKSSLEKMQIVCYKKVHIALPAYTDSEEVVVRIDSSTHMGPPSYTESEGVVDAIGGAMLEVCGQPRSTWARAMEYLSRRLLWWR